MDIAKRIRNLAAEPVSLKALGLGEQALEPKVRAILSGPPPPDWHSTGINREFYLDLMERIIRIAAAWVDDDGRVIDPILKQESGQASSRFAAPGAILLHFGRVPELRETVFRNMDYCCRILPTGEARMKSPDFWMRELVTAYMALENVADVGRLSRWAAGLSAVEPEAIYTRVSPDGTRLGQLGNWAIYGAAGEAMREAAGLRPGRDVLWGRAFFDRYVGAQLGQFTEDGMYRDPGDPITYDITTRLQIACGLAFGYEGSHFAALNELLRRGGLTTLLFVTPEGFCPYGGRSAAFHFREAILAALCELEARRYAAADPRLAGAFKRQARLSALSTRRWLLDLKPWRHSKNGFEPAMHHGNDSYASYSGYGLLTASFMGLAALCADDAIPEAPAPAELGGFACALTPAFHKVFAHCAGSYVEIDTMADPHYDATGLGGFVVRGIPPELGLAMPFATAMSKGGAPAISMAPGCVQPAEPVAIGPLWRKNGAWVSLAGLSEGLTHRVSVGQETPQAVEFEVTYTHGETAVVEKYRLEADRLTIASRVSMAGDSVPALRFTVPLLVTDGCSRSEIQGPVAGKVTVTYLGRTCEVRYGKDIEAIIEPVEYANRNGVYRSLVLSAESAVIKLTIELR